MQGGRRPRAGARRPGAAELAARRQRPARADRRADPRGERQRGGGGARATRSASRCRAWAPSRPAPPACSRRLRGLGVDARRPSCTTAAGLSRRNRISPPWCSALLQRGRRPGRPARAAQPDRRPAGGRVHRIADLSLRQRRRPRRADWCAPRPARSPACTRSPGWSTAGTATRWSFVAGRRQGRRWTTTVDAQEALDRLAAALAACRCAARALAATPGRRTAPARVGDMSTRWSTGTSRSLGLTDRRRRARRLRSRRPARPSPSCASDADALHRRWSGSSPGSTPRPAPRRCWSSTGAAGSRPTPTASPSSSPLVDKLAEKKGTPTGVSPAFGSRVTGAEVGAAARLPRHARCSASSTRSTTRAGRLLLVAPNIVHVERELGVDPRDFRLWVCLHEETHRVQFTAYPWMRDHLSRADARRWSTPIEPQRAARRRPAPRSAEVDPRRAAAACSTCSRTPEQKEILDRVTGVMSLLEGHADVVMDGVGPSVIPTVEKIRAKFNERRKGVGTPRQAAAPAARPRRQDGAVPRRRDLRAPRRRQGRHGRLQRHLGGPGDPAVQGRDRRPGCLGRPGACDAPTRSRRRGPAAGPLAPWPTLRARRRRSLVACSGGADSLALAAAAVFEGHKLGLRVLGATVDHGLQPGSAEQADRVVAQLAALGVDETLTARVQVDGASGLGPEAAAREAQVRRAGGGRGARRCAAPCCSGTPSTTRPRPCCSG